ncbi:hypothetical protein L1987_35004 [Smallanthus sonchifolius]|uniref:Uncharacterized protein n=1 Tax=Smallanthus sonchifolius TaxID=185202 RepID=A0ACB9HWT7_9ASTR|nr:hypothetical protein L1987_35004 [Smallanthus sonchifolius]
MKLVPLFETLDTACWSAIPSINHSASLTRIAANVIPPQALPSPLGNLLLQLWKTIKLRIRRANKSLVFQSKCLTKLN